MFAFADVMHLLAHEFAGLGAGRLAFTRVLTRTVDGLSFRHKPPFVESSIKAAQRASAIAFTREKHFR
jgi:hypothetical protein